MDYINYANLVNMLIKLNKLLRKLIKLAQAACVRHACLRAPCIAWPLLSPTFALSFFLRLLLLTHFGESPMCEIIFTQYLGITRRYMQKKYFFQVIFIFLDFLRPAFGHGRLGHPQSLEYLIMLQCENYAKILCTVCLMNNYMNEEKSMSCVKL